MHTSPPISCPAISAHNFALGHIRLAEEVLPRLTALLGDESNARFVIGGLLDAHKHGKHGRNISYEDRALNAHVLGDLRKNRHCVISAFVVRTCIIEVVTDLAQNRTVVRLGLARNATRLPKYQQTF